MISDSLYRQITTQFPKRKISIDVSEDNENGSYKEYDWDPSEVLPRLPEITPLELMGIQVRENKRIHHVDLKDLSNNEVNLVIKLLKELAVNEPICAISRRFVQHRSGLNSIPIRSNKRTKILRRMK